MTARFLVADVFDGLATLDDGSVDLVVTSPPFLALRSYLPAEHPDKAKEIGSEPTPAEFIDTMLAVAAELRRVLAPHGSICIEIGDTYAGSGESGWERDKGEYRRENRSTASANGQLEQRRDLSHGWPLAKSKTLIPQLLEVALAYGFNPLTGSESPAGKWRIRNVVTWARPNPPVGALGDKWRPATSDVIVACVSDKRYWDDLATRRPAATGYDVSYRTPTTTEERGGARSGGMFNGIEQNNPAGAPLLDYWEIPPGGYKGSHYAVFPEALVVPLVKAMCPEKVCRTCGEPSRRIVETTNAVGFGVYQSPGRDKDSYDATRDINKHAPDAAEKVTLGWTDCSHDNWRPGIVLDPFAGSGTTLAVASGHGHDALGIDLDERNLELARERVGPFFFEEVTV
jgi:site-specific DNA-methyltransferase (adenine-specific)